MDCTIDIHKVLFSSKYNYSVLLCAQTEEPLSKMELSDVLS